MDTHAASGFHALNGQEIIEFIAARVKAKMEASGEFALNNTFPLFESSFSIKITTYQGNTEYEDKVITVEGSDIQGVPSGVGKDILVEEKEFVDTPDKARVETDQPLVAPAPGPGGQIIDKVVPPKHHTGKKA